MKKKSKIFGHFDFSYPMIFGTISGVIFFKGLILITHIASLHTFLSIFLVFTFTSLQYFFAFLKRHLIFAFATTHFTRLHAVYFNCIFLTFTSLHHFFAFLRRQKIFAFVKWPVIVTNFNLWYTGLRFFPTVILTLGIIQLKIISNITRVGKEYKNLWQTLVDMIFPCLNFPSSFLMGKSNENKQCQQISSFCLIFKELMIGLIFIDSPTRRDIF